MSKKSNLEKKSKPEFIFQKKNYQVLFIGIACIVLGFILMSGGGSDDPNVFNPNIYSFRRIRLAPTLVLIGLGTIAYSILINPTQKKK